MTRTTRFTKMHGIGNDYIYVNILRFPIHNPGKIATEWSTCHTRISSDGLVLIGHSDKVDFSMRTFNADGSETMVHGNVSRCIGKYFHEYGPTSKNIIVLETLSGIKVLKLHLEAQTIKATTIDTDVPLKTRTIDFDSKFSFVSAQVPVGNSRLVTFVDDIRSIDLSEISPKLGRHLLFPDRTNVEFTQIVGENKIRTRVWERGSDIIQACGTSTCTTVIVAHLTERTGRTVDIVMDGGTLTIKWDEAANRMYMAGSVVKVFDGTVELGEW